MDLWRLMIGRPLKRSEAAREEITAPEGLAALSLDALTSVAYGPQAVILVLLAAGTGALRLLLPITVAIVGLLAILVLSYTQVIDAYPGGGGAYAVSKENLGLGWSRLAAAALIIDYVLTVAVSVAAGVASLTSAFPALLPETVPLCLAVLALITILNLRGVGESARAFLLPTFVFIAGLLLIILLGLLHGAGAHPTGIQPVSPLAATVGVLLVLKAFSAGCSALTGVEAIANGVPIFQEPRAARAKRTEVMLGLILGLMLLGLAVLARHFAVIPTLGATALSQIMVHAVGRGWLYYTVAMAVTVTLGLAANTSFGGLPVLASLLARDHYLPHVFAIRGDRLVFQYGIWALAALAGLLLVAVRGNTDAMIPMYAIGVFTGFTLSQAGLVVHWWRQRPRRWLLRAGVNGLGSVVTGLATLVFLATKFTEGAWVVVLAVPLFIVLFNRIHRYYARLREELAVEGPPPHPVAESTLVIVPVRDITRLTADALSAATSFGDEVVAVTVEFAEPGADAEAVAQRTRSIEERWAQWQPGVRLVTLSSQYHSVVRPLLRFIRSIDGRAQRRVMVLIPELVPRTFWEQLLHNQLGLILALRLRNQANVVVGMLPYHVRRAGVAAPPAPGDAAATREPARP
jgi:amino acid transporter